MKSALLVVIISTIHFVAGLWLSIKSFSQTFSAFDMNRELTMLEKINYVIVEVLFFPVVTLFKTTDYEGENLITQYLPFVLNSALWGVCIVFGYKIITHKK